MTVSLLRSPVKTLYLFGIVAKDTIAHYTKSFIQHPGVIFVLLPLLILYLALDNVSGAHQETVSEVEELVAMAVWWLGLGILSSVGLGTILSLQQE
jgi:hypothetical protein